MRPQATSGAELVSCRAEQELPFVRFLVPRWRNGSSWRVSGVLKPSAFNGAPRSDPGLGGATAVVLRIRPFYAEIALGYTPDMRKHVLIADNAAHRFLFNPSWDWKARLKGIETETVNVPSGAAIPPLDGFTHVILAGSRTSILQPKPWFEEEAELIREAVDRGIPILGSCFGHQMLVYALSGSGFLQRADPPEIGWAEIEMVESDPLFDGLPNPWSTFVCHFDEAVDPPEPWRKLGRTRRCDTHVLRYGDQPVWGIQPHPEISSRKAKLFVRFMLLFGRKPVRHILRALHTTPPRNDVADTVLRRFLSI